MIWCTMYIPAAEVLRAAAACPAAQQLLLLLLLLHAACMNSAITFLHPSCLLTMLRIGQSAEIGQHAILRLIATSHG